MKIRISEALLAMTRDPLSLLNCMMFTQLLLGVEVPVSLLVPVLLLGYFSQVLKGAILADQAQLPQARDLPSAMGLGCMGSIFLWGSSFIALSGAAIFGNGFEFLWERWGWMLLVAPPALWALAAVWSGLIHTHYAYSSDPDQGGKMIVSSLKIFFRPPISADGLLLITLFGLAAGCGYLWHSALTPCIPLCFMLSHCLGQHLRRSLGFELS